MKADEPEDTAEDALYRAHWIIRQLCDHLVNAAIVPREEDRLAWLHMVTGAQRYLVNNHKYGIPLGDEFVERPKNGGQ